MKAGGLARDTARTAFTIECQAVTGGVLLRTSTTGNDLDPNGYTLLIDGDPLTEPLPDDPYGYYGRADVRFSLSDRRLFERVPPGNHTYELTDVAPNCGVDGTNPQAVSVTVGATSDVVFDVVCTNVP